MIKFLRWLYKVLILALYLAFPLSELASLIWMDCFSTLKTSKFCSYILRLTISISSILYSYFSPISHHPLTPSQVYPLHERDFSKIQQTAPPVVNQSSTAGTTWSSSRSNFPRSMYVPATQGFPVVFRSSPTPIFKTRRSTLL
jgi:hypothetical protein